MSDPDCLFCKIVAGEIPGHLVLTTDHVVAFRDVNPVAPTHVLVVPRHAFDRPLVQRDRVGEGRPRVELTSLGQRDPVVAPEQVRILPRRAVLDDQLDVLEAFVHPRGQRVERLHDQLLEVFAVHHHQPRRAANAESASMTTR